MGNTVPKHLLPKICTFTFDTPVRKVHLETQFTNSGTRDVGLQILENEQNGHQKAGLFKSKYS